MCTLYSNRRSQEEARRLTKAFRDTVGNLAPLSAIFPDRLAPVAFTAPDGTRELTMMRWGFPPPPGPSKELVVNVRNVGKGYWREWLEPQWRCLVPATSFCEYAPTAPRKTPTWFALDESRPLFAFAGIWRPWSGTRGTKAEPAEGEHRLFAFLTTDANAEVKPVHRNAMPVILTTEAERDAWMTAPVKEALKLQRPLPDGSLRIVARGERRDEAA